MSEQHALARPTPHLTIGTLGHEGHGKTTLTAALTHLLPTDPGPGAAPPTPRGLTRTGYRTDTRHYSHLDLPGAARDVPAALAGIPQLDGAVLVVSVLDGVGAQTAEHVALARRLGVEHLVVALSKAEHGADELTELVELEVRALLSAHGYAGDTLPAVRVSAARALAGDPRWTGTVEALMDAVDTYVPQPVRDTGAPLLMPAESATRVPGGSRFAGTVVRGTLRTGDPVRLYAPGERADLRIAGIAVRGLPAPEAHAGDGAVVLAEGPRPVAGSGAGSGVGSGAVGPGVLLAAPRGVTEGRGAGARLRPLAAPLPSGRRFRFHFRTAEVGGTLHLATADTARPGETVDASVLLDAPMPLEKGLRFVVRTTAGTVASGTVTDVRAAPARDRAPGAYEGEGEDDGAY